jgi:hypothetical protein
MNSNIQKEFLKTGFVGEVDKTVQLCIVFEREKYRPTVRGCKPQEPNP